MAVENHLRRAWEILRLVVCCALLPCVAHGQAGPDQSDEVAKAISRVESGTFSMIDVDQITRAHAVQAIPVLENQFVGASDEANLKGKIAVALVRLGDENDIYWNYLIEQATEAVNSDVPFPLARDSQGKYIRGQVSSEFDAWIKAHNMPQEEAAGLANSLPMKVLIMSDARDPRGIPLLRQALRSPNPMIAIMGANGLTAFPQDKTSISLIIAACKRSPREEAETMAQSLIYFDDAAAQSTADLYLPSEITRSLREERAKGMTLLP